MEQLLAITSEQVRPTLHEGRDDSPELGTVGMQKLFDAHPSLNTAGINDIAAKQNANNAAVQKSLDLSVQSYDVRQLRVNTDNQLETSPDGVNFNPTGSSGHLILDSTGTPLPQRGRLKFSGASVVSDDPAGRVTTVTGVKGDKGDTGSIGLTGPTGPQGLSGRVYLPVMTDGGDILWQLVNDSGTVPPQRNIRGPQGVQGAQGTQGPQGAQGIQGAQGAQGVQGPQGPQGADGASGLDGRSFTVHGRYNTLLDLQTDYPEGQDGDAWAVGSISNNNVYVWDITVAMWKNIGPIQGPMGPQGAQGEPGAQGVQGAQGAHGADGAQGIQGIQGERGIQGVQGERGVQGLPTMVNGKAGESIALNASDVGADPAGSSAAALTGAKQYADVGLAGKANSSHTHTATYAATIGTSWSGSGPWTQNVTVAGITAGDAPIADAVLSGTADTDRARLEAWGCVSRITTYAGGITVTCLDEKPTAAVPIQLKVVR